MKDIFYEALQLYNQGRVDECLDLIANLEAFFEGSSIADDLKADLFLLRSRCFFELERFEESLLDAEISNQLRESFIPLAIQAQCYVFYEQSLQAASILEKLIHMRAPSLYYERIVKDLKGKVDKEIAAHGIRRDSGEKNGLKRSLSSHSIHDNKSSIEQRWSQNSNTVFLEFFVETTAEGVDVELEGTVLSIFITTDDVDHVFEFLLYDECIDFVVSVRNRVEIRLSKKSSLKWPTLTRVFEHSENLSKWESIEKNLEVLEEERKKHTPQSLENVIADAYNADEDKQKAIMKSLRESNGTVLSTNWEDVKDKKIDPM
ncbi:hypothetical protein PCE1_003713 [Barthelona sp. PCE]